jgi:hypothetical protein
MSIPDQLKKINAWALGAVCLILGMSLGFGSFKLSAFEGQKQAIRVDSSRVVTAEQGKIGDSSAATTQSKSQRVVASKSGTKYHFLTCPGAKTIAEKNRKYFESPEAAQKAGFTLAANCKMK